MYDLFFHSWDQLLRTIAATATTYLALIVLLRIAGQRTLAKWYAFDLIVTVALGSTFANGVLSKDVTISQAVVGFTVLIALQYAIAWTVVRWSYFRVIVNPQPTLVWHNGNFLPEPMRRQRVSEADVRAAVRRNGNSRLEEIDAVVLEADGTFSVVNRLSGNASAMADIPELGGSTNANRPH